MVLLDLAGLGCASGRAEIVEELDVGLVEVFPLLGGVVFVEDRLDGTDRLTCTAVDALVGVDVEHPLALVNAVDGTFVDTRLVEQVDTRLGDDVGHDLLLRMASLVFTTTTSTRAKGSAVSAPEPSSGDARWPDAAWIRTALGRRVTVRSLAGVPGPTGGPGFRDVVGFVEAIDVQPDGYWAIRIRTGETVMVNPAAVVAAKIVPDTPARLRLASEIDVATLESIAAKAWQPLEQAQLGEWVLRAAGGFTGRANSVLPLGDPGEPLDFALAEVVAWYRDRSLPPMIQVPLPLSTDLDDALAQRGWEAHNAVSVMVCDRDQLLMASEQAPAEAVSVDVAQAPDAAWLTSFRYGNESVPASAVPIMTKAEHPIFVSARDPAGDTLAIARGAICGRWLGVTAVEVAAPYRRRGLGRLVINSLARYAGDYGCRYVFLQVAHDNLGARSLYDGLGFITHHDYVYRRLVAVRR